MQCEGLFDIPIAQRSEQKWVVDFELPERWNVGLIVGPSGCGKTTIAREVFGDAIAPESWRWPHSQAIIDGFPRSMSIKEIIELLCSVGFSSPPSWLRPFRVLSTGEQFRAHVARTLAELGELAVVDEFTSVVDRTVAKIASAAVQKCVRRRAQRLIAVTCHYDIVEWLEPDWIYDPSTGEFRVGRSLRRPEIKLDVFRVHHSAWQIFRKHHYLSSVLNHSAVCFLAEWEKRPVAFSSWVHFVTRRSAGATKREHRTVTLPDFQGVGIGNALSNFCASLWRGLGFRAISTTSHPAMIRLRLASKNWVCRRYGSSSSSSTWRRATGFRAGTGTAWNRWTAGFEYIGPAMARAEAKRLLEELSAEGNQC
jgi:GNAT superfamily N-acetyltransferase